MKKNKNLENINDESPDASATLRKISTFGQHFKNTKIKSNKFLQINWVQNILLRYKKIKNYNKHYFQVNFKFI